MAPRPKKPIVKLRIVSNVVGGPLTIETLGTKAQAGAKLDHYRLAWGDGAVQEGLGTPPLRLSHQYSENGDFAVQLTVWDSKNMSNAASLSASIWVNPPSPVPPDPPDPPDPPSGPRILVVEGNIQFLGTAEIPPVLSDGVSVTTSASVFGTVPVYRGQGGLTVRDVGGTPYFLSTAYNTANGFNGAPYRFHCPSWATVAPFPSCVIDEEYGDVFDGKRVDLNDSPADGYTYGPLSIHWQAAAAKLWWSYSGDPYANDCTGTACPNASLGYSTLGASSGAGQASYKFDVVGFKLRNGPIIPVPAWFATQYFGGKDYLLGNKGYQSGGGLSIDPAGLVLDLPLSGHLSTVPVSAFKQVMARDWLDCGKRYVRPAWVPALASALDCGLTRSQWLDYPAGDMVWVDNGVRHGLIAFSNYSLGFVSYIAAAVQQGGGTTGMAVIDPAHLAEVYAGTRAADNVPFTSAWGVHYPVYDYASPPFVVQEKVAATVDAIAATDRYRFTFAAPHGMGVGGQFVTFGSGGDVPVGFDSGYTIETVLNATQFEACPGQACGAINVPVDYSGANIHLQLASTSNSVALGSVWAATGSPCGQDNTFAVITDSDYPTGSWRRYVHCYKVN